MKFLNLLIISIVSFTLFSCGDSNKELLKIVEERDSLLQIQKEQNEKISDYDKTECDTGLNCLPRKYAIR